MVRNFAEGLLT